MTHYERSGDDIDRGLVGYWKLDDLKAGPEVTKAIDQASFNDGVIDGPINTEGINGLNADAMFFDGVDDDMVSTFTGTLPIFTISILVKFNSFDTSFGRIFHISNNTFAFYESSTDGSLQFQYRNSSDAQKFGNSVGILNTNEWYNTIISFDGINFRLYINEILNNTIPADGGFKPIITGPIRIGSSDGGSFLNGSMQNFRLYNRALTEGEISKIARLRL